MKGLVYILGMLLLLTGCRNNPHSFLRLAEEMWNKAEYDSVQYYLVQVDSSALRGEAVYDYYWLRLHSHHVLGTLDTMKTDSLLRMLEEHYPEGHERAFRTRLLRVFFTFSRLKDNARADSLLDCLHPWMKTGFDSVSWYSYKLNHKHRMGDLDATYPDFTQKLQESFPSLNEKDINFCCLVRIKMSLQNLSDIYCISGNSVSRRKLRLKEKLGIDKKESLTQFLNRFT